MGIQGGEHALDRGLSCLFIVNVTRIPVGNDIHGFLVITFNIVSFGVGNHPFGRHTIAETYRAANRAPNQGGN